MEKVVLEEEALTVPEAYLKEMKVVIHRQKVTEAELGMTLAAVAVVVVEAVPEDPVVQLVALM